MVADFVHRYPHRRRGDRRRLRKPGPQDRGPGGHPGREPARVALRRPRHPVQPRHRGHHLPLPSGQSDSLHPEGQRCPHRGRVQSGSGREGPLREGASPRPAARGGDGRLRGHGLANALLGARSGTPRPRPRQGPHKAPRRHGAAGRPRDPHLHLGHHRRSQGRDAHPRQSRLEHRDLRRGDLLHPRARRLGPLVPAAVPRVRAHGR